MHISDVFGEHFKRIEKWQVNPFIFATKCDNNHSYDQMGKVLGVLANFLYQTVFRYKVVFTNERNDSKTCYFCQSPAAKITKEVLKKVAS